MTLEASVKRQIIIVDDKQPVMDAVAGFARIDGWKVVKSDGKAIPDSIEIIPTLVLVDYRLGGNTKPGEWINKLRKQHPTLRARVYLLSGVILAENKSDQELKSLLDEPVIAGVLTKPLDLTRLRTLLGEVEELPTLRSATSKARESDWIKNRVMQQAANDFELPLRLLDAKTLQAIYQNEAAKSEGFDEMSHLSVQLVNNQIKGEKEHQGSQIHWDSSSKEWVRTSMFRAKDWYWMVQNRTRKGPSRLLRQSGDNQTLEELASRLNNQHGFTRIRLYRVAKLRNNDTSEKTEFVFQPDWEKGGGFEPNKKEWESHEFLYEENSQTEGLLTDPQHPWIPIAVDDKNPNCREGCPSIRWGKGQGAAKHRVSIPIWDDDKRKPIAFIALDQRYDHILNDQGNENLPYPIRFAQDQFSTSITDNDLKLVAGLINLAQSSIQARVQHRRQSRFQTWNDVLTDIIKEKTQDVEARLVLVETLKEIKTRWCSGGKDQLSDLCLLRRHDDGFLEAWAGDGPRWKLLSHELFDVFGPFKQALKDVYAIQDFPKWYALYSDSVKTDLENVFGRKSSKLGLIESWFKEVKGFLGIPLKQGDNTFGVLVITATRENYFTEARVRRLENTAARLTPMLLWDLAQAQRDWLRRALAHEYRVPVNRLRALLKKLPVEQQREAEGLLCYQEAITKNLKYLGDESISIEEKASTPLSETLTSVGNTLEYLYPGRILIEVNNFGPLYVGVSGDILYQILFNLLENAYKFTEKGKEIRLVGEDIDNQFSLEIWNHSVKPISLQDQPKIFKAYQRAQDAPVAKGAGIGLAIVKKLCGIAKLSCELTEAGSMAKPDICFTLKLPFASTQ